MEWGARCARIGPTSSRNRRGIPIHISHLSLVNFRNYEHLDLDLGPGMILLHGPNGQGKSNLIEAIYMLAIARSPRTSSEREVVRVQQIREETHCQVLAVVQRGSDSTRLQVGLRATPRNSEQERGQSDHETRGSRRDGSWRRPAADFSIQKYIRVNGAPRRSADLVGQLNAVMFSAQDLELVYGPPPVRRRYLDILISQVDNRYLRTLQRYQHVLHQRNQLLKMVREGRSKATELEFWDQGLVSEGAYIIARRLDATGRLSSLADAAHRGLTGEIEGLTLLYRAAFTMGPDKSKDGLSRDLAQSLETMRAREISQGVTMSGPHRDDLQLLIGDNEAAAYSSRGQCRTASLAMRLAEAYYLKEERGEEPVLLLDDVLSELDVARRAHVLSAVSRYEQCFITTADIASIESPFLGGMSIYKVRSGNVEGENLAAAAAPPA